MSETLTVAAIQSSFGATREENVARVEALVREAASRGAQLVLPPELFEGPYFPREEDERFFDLALPFEGHPTIARMAELARALSVAIPVSFFERAGPAYYNSLAMVGPDGSVLGLYRKAHIPDGPGYEEKFYFRPGDTGFRVWALPWATGGAGICWDQWFPETARSLVLMGADVLLYPTAIGSEPKEPDLDTRGPWQRAMQGHAASNIVPVVAANRTGDEQGQRFYGHSFITDHLGRIVAELGDGEEGVILHTFDLAEVRRKRAAFGFFRDRRPDLYGILVERGAGER